MPVFDLAQTEGPPVPEPATPKLLGGDAPAGLWDALAGEVAEHGFRLRRSGIGDLDGANGLTDFASRDVWVRSDVDAAQAVKTLAHELGHILLHDPQHSQQPGDVHRRAAGGRVACGGVREVEAESVAYLVTAAHGLEAGTYTFAYVASWAERPATAERISVADVVARTGARVMAAAAQLIDTTTLAAAPDPAVSLLTVRATDATHRSTLLREQSSRAAAVVVTLDERRVLTGVVADSQDLFRARLGQSWVAGYLDDRGLREALDSHGLGYAPKGWTSLVDHLGRLGYTDNHIEAAGMASRSRNGWLIDRFRDRLTIPVRDDSGELVGFVGRLAPGREVDRYNAKYLNSPATALYTKSNVLYGLGAHRSRIGDGYLPVLCEGPLDAIAVDLAGHATTARIVGVAASGTAFTAAHAELLTRLVGERPICLAFDADPAGRTATETVWRRLTDSGPRPVLVAAIPDGSDPAELVRLGDHQALTAAVADARPAANVICDNLLDGVDLAGNSPRQLATFRQLLAYADRIPVHERAAFILGLADRLDLPVDLAAAEVAARNPNLLADRTVDHCRQIGRQLDQPPTDTTDRSDVDVGPAAITRHPT